MKKFLIASAFLALGLTTNMRMEQTLEEEALLLPTDQNTVQDNELPAVTGEVDQPVEATEAGEPEILYATADEPAGEPEILYATADEPTEGPVYVNDEVEAPVLGGDGGYVLEDNIVGGWSDLNEDQIANDDEIKGLIDYGVSKIRDHAVEQGDLWPGAVDLKLFKVNKAQYQVVSGTNYDFSVTYSDEINYRVTYTFQLYDQPWTNTRTISGACFKAESRVWLE